MTRGKHGISAAAKRVVGEREQQIAGYQHNIRKLTAENAELKQKLADQQAAHSNTVRVLKAERDEGLSPQLAVLQRENVALKERADRAQRECRKISDLWRTVGERLIRHFTTAHNLSSIAAVEEWARLCGGVTAFQVALAGEEDREPEPVHVVENSHERKLGVKGIEAVRRARGERS